MKFALFCHSIISDWNNGNAHFLRGMARALQARGHHVRCFEQRDNWSLVHLLREDAQAIDRFRQRFPDLQVERYELGPELGLDLSDQLAGTDVLIVHEWNEPGVARLLHRLARTLHIRTLFHDTHYRVVTDESYRAPLQLDRFDLIIAFSPSLACRYEQLGFQNVRVLHEAADTTVFWPRCVAKVDDVVFVGNYGDGDRSREIDSYLFRPRRALSHLRFALYGVRYPPALLARMRDTLDVDYRGWLANTLVPDAYSAAKVVLHIPRREYVDLLPGTPTIRVFEALATGACLVSLPWPDPERLFSAGKDFAVAHSPAEMRTLLEWLCADDAARRQLGDHGRRTVQARHTCDHRAGQLLELL